MGKKRILVTGGAGFIGSHIVDALVGEHEVVVVDNLSTGKRENLGDKAGLIEEVDIRSYGDLKKVFSDFKPDIVSHQAANASVSASVENPEEDAMINVIGSLNVLKACVENKVEKIIFASSGGAVYGEVKSKGAKEDDSIAPLAPYGVSKAAFENYLRSFYQWRGLNFTVLRYTNVYGPRQDPDGEAGVVAIFTKSVLEGRVSTINGDGEYIRDYVYVKDVVDANLKAFSSGDGEIFNIGTSTETSVNELYEKIKGIGRSDKEALYGDPRQGDLRRSVVSIKKAKKGLGWEPKYDLNKGLNETMNWFKEKVKC